MDEHSVCTSLVSPHSVVRYLFYNASVGLPTLAFVIFLAWNARPAVEKLRQSHSQIMSTYYVFLWGVEALNLLRILLQVVTSTEASHPALWNWLWIGTRFGLELLEVSVVVFLLQGYLRTGREALVRTLYVSGGFAAVDTLIKAMFVFGLHIPLFLYGGDEATTGDLSWAKWSYWLLHSLLFLTVYTAILVLPHTRWRELLPAKPSFYRYIAALWCFNFLAAFGALLLGCKVVQGYCIYSMAEFLYYAAFPILIYVTFLSEFFQTSADDEDLAFYSEMRESGYLEAQDDGFDDGW